MQVLSSWWPLVLCRVSRGPSSKLSSGLVTVNPDTSSRMSSRDRGKGQSSLTSKCTYTLGVPKYRVLRPNTQLQPLSNCSDLFDSSSNGVVLLNLCTVHWHWHPYFLEHCFRHLPSYGDNDSHPYNPLCLSLWYYCVVKLVIIPSVSVRNFKFLLSLLKHDIIDNLHLAAEMFLFSVWPFAHGISYTDSSTLVNDSY